MYKFAITLLISFLVATFYSPAKALEALYPDEKITFSSRFELGNYLIETQNYAQAEIEFSKLLVIFPENTKLLSMLGACQLMLDKSGEAETHIEKAVALEPNNYLLLNLLSQIYTSQNLVNKAMDLMEQSLKANRNQNSLRLELSRFYIDSGKSVLAEPHLKLLQLDKEFARNPEAHFLFGRVLECNGQLSESLREYQKAFALKPSNKVYRMALSLGYLRVNKFKEAIPLLQMNLKNAPSDSSLYVLLGDALYQCRQLEMAEKIWNQGLILFPQQVDLKTRLLDLFINTNRVEDAKSLLEASRNDRRFEKDYQLLLLRYHRKLGELALASKLMARNKIKANGDYLMALTWEESELSYNRGYWQQANYAADQMLNAKYHVLEAYVLKAKVAWAKGDRFKAQDYLMQAQKINPYDLKVYHLAKEVMDEDQMPKVSGNGRDVMPRVSTVFINN